MGGTAIAWRGGGVKSQISTFTLPLSVAKQIAEGVFSIANSTPQRLKSDVLFGVSARVELGG
jgi:hypothetical protein